jgi:hypothetical protein
VFREVKIWSPQKAKLVGVNGNQSISQNAVNQHSGHLERDVMARKSYQAVSCGGFIRTEQTLGR